MTIERLMTTVIVAIVGALTTMFVAVFLAASALGFDMDTGDGFWLAVGLTFGALGLGMAGGLGWLLVLAFDAMSGSPAPDARPALRCD